MKRKATKIFSIAAAAAITATALTAVMPASAVDGGTVIFESEAEVLEGAELWTSIYETQLPGYSGEGFAYLTGQAIKMEVEAPEEGMYEVKARYTQILDGGSRKQTISVNGSDYMVDFPYADKWTDISMGLFRLKKGANTIELKPQYGYASYDTITISKAMPNDYSKATDATCDANATKETKSLMKYLKSVYGEHIISGQQEIYGGGNDGNMELEFEWIQENFGTQPAIRGFDFMNYNPLYGWEDGTTERCIDWVKEKNGIATASWHINVPNDFANYELGTPVDWTECTYTEKSDFDTSQAVIEGTKENQYLLSAIEMLAEQLTLLQEANVPIILRPFHEAEGNGGVNGEGAWFWWSKSGAEVYKKLWKLLYTQLTEEYGLHNIIWEFNSYDYSTSPAWYPGDEYVDIVGFDKYNTVYNRHDGKTSGPNVDAISSTFKSLYELTEGRKMVSMPENDTVPTVENMTLENANWLYFCPWYGEHLMDSNKNDPETLKAIYNSDYCITLDELPENLYSFEGIHENPTDEPTEKPTTEPTETETSTTTPVLIYGDADDSGEVNLADAVTIVSYIANAELYPLNEKQIDLADVANRGDGINADDAITVQKHLLGEITELPASYMK